MERDDDTERFRALFDATYASVHAYARRRADAAVADDVVAETFLVAWRRLGDVPVGSELPWLYGVARRVLANARRSQVRWIGLQRRIADQPTYDAASPAANDVVRHALARLPPADQEVLRLAAWEDLAAPDIAVVLGCTPNAAALRLSRARRRLREVLTETNPARTQAPTEDGDA